MLTKAQLRQMTVPQLRAMIRKHNIKGYSTMKKEELVSAIHKHQMKPMEAPGRSESAPRRGAPKKKKPPAEPPAPRRGKRTRKAAQRLIEM